MMGARRGRQSTMHCLLTIAQSALVPSLGCDCAGRQRPDSAHPFPEGELWKPKTVAISSLAPPLILRSCLALPPFWPVAWQRPCIKGSCRTMQRGPASQEFEEVFFIILLFFFKTGISHWHWSSVISWVDLLSSCWNQEPETI